MEMPSQTTQQIQARRFRRTAPMRWIVVAFLALLVPVAAGAAPITYELVAGSATIRASLAGQTQSIFLGTTGVHVPLSSVSVMFDADLGSHGRLDSLSITLADFSIVLDQSLVALDTLDVSGPTISSLSGSDLNVFGQL